MNSILENELVKKYFGSCEHGAYREKPCLCALNYAGNVLQAMQEPIKKGERQLSLHPLGSETWVEEESIGYDGPRFFALRLPDKFQKKECDILGHPCNHCGKPEEFHRPKEVQKRECECICHGTEHGCCKQQWTTKTQPQREEDQTCRDPELHGGDLPKKDEVEEKIKEIAEEWIGIGPQERIQPRYVFSAQLRELVRLARESK